VPTGVPAGDATVTASVDAGAGPVAVAATATAEVTDTASTSIDVAVAAEDVAGDVESGATSVANIAAQVGTSS
jgi:hypothetical protein